MIIPAHRASGPLPPVRFRELAEQLLANAAGPNETYVFPMRDGSIVFSLKPLYVWSTVLPDGDSYRYIAPSPESNYAPLIDRLATRLWLGKLRWGSLRHSEPCRAFEVGCICEPIAPPDFVWSDER